MPTNMSQGPVIGDVLHQWTVQEYRQFDRVTAWYVIMGIIGFLFVLYGLFTGNFLFSLIMILFAIIIFLQTHQEPPQIPFQITEFGVIISNRFYSYTELDGFYIIYDPPFVKTLYIETQSIFRPILHIPILDENPVEIRHALQQYLEEDLEKEDEPMADKIARSFGIH